MSLLVVGSVAIDTIETPFGKAENVLGGSAVHFSLAASLLCKVRLVGVVGDDFSNGYIQLLRSRQVDTEGLQKRSGETFFWHGRYGYNLQEAETVETKLNVFENFTPSLPEKYKDSPYVFLANIDPDLQLHVLEQLVEPRLVALDTMNFWIKKKADSLKETIRRVNLLIINDAEARQITGEHSLVIAAGKLRGLGPEMVVIKRGEHGALLFTTNYVFCAPAYPLSAVYDPTGAGDCFAGGLMGYLAKVGQTGSIYVRQAVIMGSVMASFNIEKFGTEKIREISMDEVRKRFDEFKKLTYFEDLEQS